MTRSLLPLLVSGCYIHLDKATEEPPEPPIDYPAPTGPELNYVEDVVYQVVHDVSDVLLVVQNDPDADGQQSFLEHLPVFFDYLLGSGIDWHAGVVSSGLDDPDTAGVLFDMGGQRWLDTDTPDPVSHLLWQSEDLLSRPRDAVYEALQVQGPLANAGFLREGAALTVVVVSDGEDTSTLSESELTDWLLGLGGTYSCLLTGAGTACESTAALAGGVVADVGEIWAYEELGLLATGFTREFPLSSVPEADTIVVEVESTNGAVYAFLPAELDSEGNVVDGDWIYDEVRNTIEFVQFVPSPGDAVHIRYTPAS
jgi:hypothetical protein